MDNIFRYIEYIKPYKKIIFLIMFLGLMDIIIPFLYPLAIKHVLDNVLISDMASEEKIREILYILGGMIFLFIFIRTPAEYFKGNLQMWVTQKVLYDLRNDLFKHLQRLSLKFHQNNKSGELVSKVSNDVENTKFFTNNVLLIVWLDLLLMVGVISVMFYMNVSLTILSIVFLSSYAIFGKILFTKTKKYSKEYSKSLANLQGFLQERLSGINVMKAYALEEEDYKKFVDKNKIMNDTLYKRVKWSGKNYVTILLIMDLASLFIFLFASLYVIEGDVSIGTIIAFNSYTALLFKPAKRIMNLSTLLTQSLASMERVFELLDEKEIEENLELKEKIEIKGNISFKNVTFSYDNLPALKNITFKIEEGEKVAFVGESGSGKSTITKLILGLWKADIGEIKIEEKNIKELNPINLRKNINYVEQNGIIFSDSVEENIRLGNIKAKREEVIIASKKAYAHDFVENLEKKYHTELGERGVKLSGGQQQRISIARSFLKDVPIVIFDESTSALDLNTEKLVQNSIYENYKNNTVIFVAHRLTTITNVDKIFVFKDGEIKEIGTHEELLEKKGEYYSLWKKQNVD